MSKKFAEHSQFDLSQINKEVLKKWDENNVFAKSMTEREGCPSFVFYEGPPSANVYLHAKDIRPSCFMRDLPRPMVVRVFTM